jgi:hypothetical protein
MHSYICIIAPHLGTLAEAREGPDVEPNPKTVFGGTIPKRDVLSEFLLTYSNLSRIPGKPRSIISLLPLKTINYIYVISIVALSGRSWLKTLLHNIIPCPDI